MVSAITVRHRVGSSFGLVMLSRTQAAYIGQLVGASQDCDWVRDLYRGIRDHFDGESFSYVTGATCQRVRGDASAARLDNQLEETGFPLDGKQWIINCCEGNAKPEVVLVLDPAVLRVLYVTVGGVSGSGRATDAGRVWYTMDEGLSAGRVTDWSEGWYHPICTALYGSVDAKTSYVFSAV